MVLGGHGELRDLRRREIRLENDVDLHERYRTLFR
jgi:hypothetical protein